MPEQYLVSVVVPTFDDGDLLERCLRSVAEQGVAGVEVIVVDDGSARPEALAGIDRALAAYPAVRLVRTANAGPSAARNRGLAESSGMWIAFVDADDEIAPGGIAHRLALAQSNPAVVATYGGTEFVEADGTRWRSGWMAGQRVLPINRIGDRGGVPGFLWAYLLRADTLRELGGLDTNLRIMEDFDLLARLGRGGGVVVGSSDLVCIQHRRAGSLARGSAWRQASGALCFLAKARRERYFLPLELARRYARVPYAALKIMWQNRSR